MDILDEHVNGPASVLRDTEPLGHVSAAPAPGYSSSVWAAISDLIGLTYEATLDASRRQLLLDAYVEAVGGRRGCLLLNTGGPHSSARIHWSNWPEEDSRLSVERHITDDLYRSSEMSGQEGEIRTIDLTAAAAYREVYRSLGIRYLLSGVFLRDGDHSGMIFALRGDADGPFVEPAFAILHSLMPHLRLAALLHSELFSLQLRLSAFAEHIDRYLYPFLLTDARGRVLYANAAASEATGLKDAMAITSGRLSLISPRDQAALVKALERVVTQPGPLLRLEVKRRSPKSHCLLLLMRIPCPGLALAGLPPAAVSVLIVDREAHPELDPAILRDLFFLTPAEARVAAKLGGGRSAEEIAGEMGTSIETVRTHIRRILSKTSTVRQGELISLILRAAPFRGK